MEKERSRKKDHETVEHDLVVQDELVITRHVEPITGIVVEEETARVVLEDEDYEPEPEQPQQVTELPQQAPSAGQQQMPARFKMDPAFERVDKQLFGPKDPHFPKRTVMFVVENRRDENLIPSIRKYVKPGTFVFTDHFWPTGTSETEYEHFIVVHKRRFAQYHFFRNQVVLKVTTNHIERIWVEMRKDLRGVKKEDVEKRLREVPYRMFRLWSAKFEENEEAFIADIRAYVAHMVLGQSGSAFQTARIIEQ